MLNRTHKFNWNGKRDTAVLRLFDVISFPERHTLTDAQKADFVAVIGEHCDSAVKRDLRTFIDNAADMANHPVYSRVSWKRDFCEVRPSRDGSIAVKEIRDRAVLCRRVS